MRAKLVRVPTFERDHETGAARSSEVKVAGDLIKVEKGEWSNSLQDWKAKLTFSTGVVVESGWNYKNAEGEWHNAVLRSEQSIH